MSGEWSTEFATGPDGLDTVSAEGSDTTLLHSRSDVTLSSPSSPSSSCLPLSLDLDAANSLAVQEESIAQDGDMIIREAFTRTKRAVEDPTLDCAICLDGIKTSIHAKGILACRHEFHLSCIS